MAPGAPSKLERTGRGTLPLLLGIPRRSFLLTFAEAACVPIPSEVTLGYAGYLGLDRPPGRRPRDRARRRRGVPRVVRGLVDRPLRGAPPRREVRALRPAHQLRSGQDRALVQESGASPRCSSGASCPSMRTFISIPAGLAEMSLVRFGAATLAGSAIWCTAIALVGYELGRRVEQDHQGLQCGGLRACCRRRRGHRRFHPPPLRRPCDASADGRSPLI